MALDSYGGSSSSEHPIINTSFSNERSDKASKLLEYNWKAGLAGLGQADCIEVCRMVAGLQKGWQMESP